MCRSRGPYGPVRAPRCAPSGSPTCMCCRRFTDASAGGGCPP
ncbi:hypothetical protein TOK_3817 [Pseudonocardia sp. N23]|nr:hypothetical protein TOK_3817 [Pseudonocardia sp. N23]